MSIQKDLPELIKAGILTQETANKITLYYEDKKKQSPNRIFIVFGILGALLVGMGIILILAHNWDELSIPTKTFFAFLPLLAGQAFGLLTILKKPDSLAWREGTGTFLFFAVASSISLVSQIYNIEGSLSSFLLSWVLLCLPLVYVLRSSLVSLFYIITITAYAFTSYEPGIGGYEKYFYWLLLAAVFPFYYNLLKKQAESNFTVFHNWAYSISVMYGLGALAGQMEELMYIAYFSLFGLFYMIGSFDLFAKQKLRNNAYKIIGSLGTVVLSLTLSFKWAWDHLWNKEYFIGELVVTPEFWAALILSIAAAILLYQQYKNRTYQEIQPLSVMFVLFIFAFIIGLYSAFAIALMNIYVLAIGVLTIRKGAKENHLGVLNFGLLILMTLITGRFFATDLSFVLRGVVFIVLGASFFTANYWMIKKRKQDRDAT